MLIQRSLIYFMYDLNSQPILFDHVPYLITGPHGYYKARPSFY
jgi:hypothetical protein